MKDVPGPFGKADGKDGRSTKEISDAASRARNAQDYKRAVELYRTLCNVEPKEPRHPHQAGEACMRLGYYDAAMVFLRRSVELYAASGFLARAIAVARLALTVRPDHAAALDVSRRVVALREEAISQAAAQSRTEEGESIGTYSTLGVGAFVVAMLLVLALVTRKPKGAKP